MKILVMSCDRNEDLFYPFSCCMEKYWPEHPEIIYCTEDKVNKYYKTLCPGNLSWGLRLKKCLDQINDDLILLTLDDIFIRDYVDDFKIKHFVETITNNKNIGFINLEGDYTHSSKVFDDFSNIFNPNVQKYKASVMLNLFRKDCLYLLANDIDAWEFEKQEPDNKFVYLISKTNPIDFGKNESTICNWGIVKGKWTTETIRFFRKENIEIDYSKRGVIMKPCFGIISYFPWEQPARKQRQDRLDRLVKQLSNLWPDIPIMIISQQWKFYNLNTKCKNKVIRFDYPKLGILKARQELRNHFLESEYDYLIMFDDDAIIEGTPELAAQYIKELNNHPQGFCFIQGTGSSPYTNYVDSQLNLCAISRWIYEREPIPDIDPQKSQAFEDRIWSTLLHFKYAEKEFDAPAGLKCIHFKNPNEVAPSTWSGEKRYQWKQMREKTREIEKYISENKELPPWFRK